MCLFADNDMKFESNNTKCFCGARTIIAIRTIGMRTIGMRIIGMEDNWHAENWHGGQLALIF